MHCVLIAASAVQHAEAVLVGLAPRCQDATATRNIPRVPRRAQYNDDRELFAQRQDEMTAALSEAGTLLQAVTLPPRRQLYVGFLRSPGYLELGRQRHPVSTRLVAPYLDAFDAA